MNTPEKDLAYYLTVFTLEGHETWRVHVNTNPSAFEEIEMKNWKAAKGKKAAKLSQKKVYRIDRLTGEIKLI